MIINGNTITVGYSDREYTFIENGDLPNTALQNFAFSGIQSGVVYTTQHWVVGEFANTYMSKYQRDSNPFLMRFQQPFGLLNCGHGETMEVTYVDQNREYLWVGSDATMDSQNNHFSKNIMRLLVGSDFRAQETKILCQFERASFDGKALLADKSVTRVMACVNDNQTRICFKINFGNSAPYFSIYDYNTLVTIMNQTPASNIYMKDLASACVAVYKGSPFNIFQSMTMGNKNEIFISSGNLNKDTSNKIFRYLISENRNQIRNFPSPTTAKTICFETNFPLGLYNKAEIEGIKCRNNIIYFTADFKKVGYDAQGNPIGDGQSANRTPMIALNASIFRN